MLNDTQNLKSSSTRGKRPSINTNASSITGISPSPALRPIAAASLHHLPLSSASAAVGYRGSGSAMPSSAQLCTTRV
ncbi:hypothetical protein TgHK011_003230 [Trichoderma gracile]|nr:hypothetical protein TgHK011_003230 [Trichoderma gracile]